MRNRRVLKQTRGRTETGTQYVKPLVKSIGLCEVLSTVLPNDFLSSKNRPSATHSTAVGVDSTVSYTFLYVDFTETVLIGCIFARSSNYEVVVVLIVK